MLKTFIGAADKTLLVQFAVYRCLKCSVCHT